jgi:hypothetical protein
MISASNGISILRTLVLAGTAAIYGIPTLATEPLPPGHPPIPDPPTFWPGNSLGPSLASPRDFYLTTLHSQIEQNCVGCHRTGGTAEQSGARLVLSDLPDESHEAFAAFLSLEGVDSDWVLGKVTGQYSHGGGRVTTEGSALYQNLDQYLALLTGTISTVSNQDFWRGTSAEPPEITLRRASLLFGGKVASTDAIAAAKQSEAALKEQILATMEGDGFKEFIMLGANDRLLISGFMNGMGINSNRGYYPAFIEFQRSLPENLPDEFSGEDYWDKPFLSKNAAAVDMDRAIVQEPLQLIAHVIMTDQPYGQILTASYTMVNAATDLVYRSGAGFPRDYTDKNGFYDRREFSEFRPGVNVGQVPNDEDYVVSENDEVSFSAYQEWPHAGILSTLAWLQRYPSTDTNRNRARARWTYFHFLGVDIEKSAPRTTDPVALADTNNPTMNNPACTVCHENLDPVAGAYQSFGDAGTYLDQFGGLDSLPDSYKHPEWFGGKPGSTDYREGDTWYRDMRAPGFNGEVAEGHGDSLQWLGYRISRDPRFASATVRFWWPAIFGADPLTAPEDPSGPDYDQQVSSFNAQDALIQELADKFEASGFNAKSLFADMVLSKWYRRSEIMSQSVAQARAIELATVGAGRLLTPEELDRKNLAVFGRTWRYRPADAHNVGRYSAFYGSGAEFRGFYGGIDGATVLRRNREFTALMSNVAESMATELACLVVAEQFNLPAYERTIFKGIDRSTQAGTISNSMHSLPGQVPVEQYSEVVEHSIKEQVTLVGGGIAIGINDLTSESYNSVDQENTNADVTIIEIVFTKNGYVHKRILGTELSFQASFESDTWQDEDGNIWPRGQVDRDAGGWQMHENAWVRIGTSLPAGDYEVEWRLGTTLFDNHVNDEMVVQTTITARENIDKTLSMQLLRAELQSLYLNATNRPLTEEATDNLLNLMLEHARIAAERSYRASSSGQCDLWNLGNSRQGAGHTADYDGDPAGMMRAWTMVLHSVMTSFGYLHD